MSGTIATAKASVDGDRISFESTTPIPGGEGAQEFSPPDLASRGAGGWGTQGLFPPQSEGHQALLLGWSPDFSHVFARAKKFGNPILGTITDRSTATPGAVSTIVPPTAGLERSFLAGTSDDGSVASSKAKTRRWPRVLPQKSKTSTSGTAKAKPCALPASSTTAKRPGPAPSPGPMTGRVEI